MDIIVRKDLLRFIQEYPEFSKLWTVPNEDVVAIAMWSGD